MKVITVVENTGSIYANFQHKDHKGPQGPALFGIVSHYPGPRGRVFKATRDSYGRLIRLAGWLIRTQGATIKPLTHGWAVQWTGR